SLLRSSSCFGFGFLVLGLVFPFPFCGCCGNSRGLFFFLFFLLFFVILRRRIMLQLGIITIFITAVIIIVRVIMACDIIKERTCSCRLVFHIFVEFFSEINKKEKKYRFLLFHLLVLGR